MQSISFERAASFYDATRGYMPGSAERIRDAIVAQTGATAHTRLLELGIGTGRIAVPFLTAGFSYAGIDLAPAMLAALVAKASGWPRLPLLVRGDVGQLPFTDSSFDVILAVHVLHLVADWRATLYEARRVLRPHGAHLLLAKDVGEGELPEVPLEALAPPMLAQRVWKRTLKDLGLTGKEGQPGISPQDPAVRELLEGLGATVTTLDLAEYEREPLSAREVVQGYSQRLYSADWAREAALHHAAVAQIEQWLATECPEPDRPFPRKGSFRVVLATWA
ncbi:MAG: class I SAM-dependent methyltransferase [Chloroflexales bacterium]